MNGESPNTNPERVDSPMTNLTPPPVGPPLESGAYQRPSRSTRWKFPVPPSGPPLCETPIECIVPAVGNGRSIRVSRMTEKPMVERRSEEHTSELQSQSNLVCRLLLEKKKKNQTDVG